MKKLLFLPLFLLLSGCVSYYTPTTAIEDGVYYAEDDPAYNNNDYVYNTDAYYPWASIDYFYLGATPYYPAYRYPYYSYGFGGYVGGGFSIGFSSGYYSPWYTPYYGYYPSYAYYSPWYGYRYPRYGYGRPGYGGCRYGNCYSHNGKGNNGKGNNGKGHNGKGQKGNNRGGRDRNGDSDRYAGNNRGDTGGRNGNRGNNRRVGENEDLARQPNSKGDHRGRESYTSPNTPKTIRYVSTPPDAEAGDRGVVVRTQESKTPQQSRTHQRRYTSVSKSEAPANPAATAPATRQPAANGRSAKKYRSRITPVTPIDRPEAVPQAANSGSINGKLSQRGSSEIDASSRGRNQVVQRGSDNQSRSRTMPARGNQPAATSVQQPAVNATRGAAVQAPSRQSNSRSMRQASRQAKSVSRSSGSSRSSKQSSRDRD